MNIYRRLSDRVATNEARELAERLVVWHDAMVKHLRVLGVRPGARCGEGCPHEDAASLWVAAQRAFGDEAGGLSFLRAHGHSKRRSTTPYVRDRAAEMRV
jgi:hypothetical protein